MKEKRAKKMDKKTKMKLIIAIVFIIIIISFSGILAFKMAQSEKTKEENTTNEIVNNIIEEPTVVETKKKKINIYSGDDRPIAVMIDNHKGAQPQGGLNDAYLVYEIIAEGGESRLMAVFKGANVKKIGPIRSSRHYYLDYALENNAIYVHYGWSPQAQADIPKLKVQNINGITESEKMFWRTKDKKAPHNVATTTEYILSIAQKKGYSTKSNAKSVLNYTADEVNIEDGQPANEVKIPYSDWNTARYVYNPDTKMYTRYSKGTKQKDWSTGEDVTTKNIIITFAENYTLQDGENKDRQTLKNIGTLKGYYITNGKAMPITCTKTARESKTVYKDLNGNEIQVNDGRTFIQICPIESKVIIE